MRFKKIPNKKGSPYAQGGYLRGTTKEMKTNYGKKQSAQNINKSQLQLSIKFNNDSLLALAMPYTTP